MSEVVKLTECGVVCLDGSLRKGDLEVLGVTLRAIRGVLNIVMPSGWEKKQINGCCFYLRDVEERNVLKISQKRSVPFVVVELLLRFRVYLRRSGNNGSSDLFAQVYDSERLLITTYPRRIRSDIEDEEEALIEYVTNEIIRNVESDFNGGVLVVRHY